MTPDARTPDATIRDAVALQPIAPARPAMAGTASTRSELGSDGVDARMTISPWTTCGQAALASLGDPTGGSGRAWNTAAERRVRRQPPLGAGASADDQEASMGEPDRGVRPVVRTVQAHR